MNKMIKIGSAIAGLMLLANCAGTYSVKHDGVSSTKPVHKEFQRERAIQRILGMKNVYRLAGSINSWATNPEYSNEIKDVILDNGLDKLN